MKGDQVIEKILSQAREEAESILADARKKVQEQKAELDVQLEAYKEESRRLAEQEEQDKLSRVLASARMEMKKRTLAAKRALLDELFEKVRQRINSLPDGEYQEMMSKWMHRAVETGDEEVIVGKNEKRIGHELIKQINKKLGPGFKGNLRLSDRRADIDGGFILRRGQVQINVSTDVMVNLAREKLEPELAREFFRE